MEEDAKLRWRMMVGTARSMGAVEREEAVRWKLAAEDPHVWWHSQVLVVRVLRGSGLAAKDMDGTSDPYVSLGLVDRGFTVPDKKVLRGADTKWHQAARSTPVVHRSLDPVWDEGEEFEFLLTDDVEPYVRLEVWDHDVITRDDFMGYANVMVADVPVGEMCVKELQLQCPKKHKGEVTGQIEVEVQLHSHTKARDLCKSFNFTRNVESVEEELIALVEDSERSTALWVLKLLDREPWVGDAERFQIYACLLRFLGSELGWEGMNTVHMHLPLDLSVHGPRLLEEVQDDNRAANVWLLENDALSAVNIARDHPDLLDDKLVCAWLAAHESC